MRLGDVFSESYRAISANKARSGLTILGIVIGIASVIALVAVGQGSASSITARIDSTGANLLTVSPSFQRSAGPVSAQRRPRECRPWNRPHFDACGCHRHHRLEQRGGGSS